MPRGRLIFPFTVRIGLLDTTAMARDPDGAAGPLTSGYDVDFQEPVVIKADADDTVGEVLRIETFVEAPAQIDPKVFDSINQVLGGTSPDSKMELTFHFKDLERRGLVHDDGIAKISIGDRLDSIWTCRGKLVQEIPSKPGLYVSEVRPAGFGLSMTNPQRNLLIVTLSDREQGPRR